MALENVATSKPDGDGGAMPEADVSLDTFGEAWAQEAGLAPDQPGDPVAEPDGTEELPDEAVEEQPEEDQDEQPTDEPQHEVTVDGQKLTVGLDELKRGYQRLSDYTRKTQALAEDRRQVEGAFQQRHATLEAAEARVLELLDRYEDSEPEPNWLELHRQNPLEAQEKRFEWEAKQQARAQAVAERDRLTTESRQKAANEAVAAMLQWPEVNGDRETLGKLYGQITTDAARIYGFSDAEIRQVTNPRVLAMAKDAAAYHALKASKPAVLKKATTAPAAMRGGNVVPPGAALQRRLAESGQRVAQTGTRDAFGDYWAETQRAERGLR